MLIISFYNLKLLVDSAVGAYKFLKGLVTSVDGNKSVSEFVRESKLEVVPKSRFVLAGSYYILRVLVLIGV
jgi:hypothetical protein